MTGKLIILSFVKMRSAVRFRLGHHSLFDVVIYQALGHPFCRTRETRG